MDNAPTGLALTRGWLDEQALCADLVCADMRQPFPFPDGAFHAILSTQVIHHALQATVRATAREIGRAVKPGGLILITVPAQLNDEPDAIEVEPGTFVPQSGYEKGLPHHILTPDALSALFDAFRPIELSIHGSVVISLLAIKR